MRRVPISLFYPPLLYVGINKEASKLEFDMVGAEGAHCTLSSLCLGKQMVSGYLGIHFSLVLRNLIYTHKSSNL